MENRIPQIRSNNVLLIIIDDVGIDQLRCYDDINHYNDPYPYALTPNIDRLAANGVRFTQLRSMPLCSPTRASVLSGKYPHQHGVGTLVQVGKTANNFREFGKSPAPAAPIIPAIVSGVHSAAFGKWHLGLDPAVAVSNSGTMDAHPVDLGFDSWIGVPRNLAAKENYYNYQWCVSGIRVPINNKYITEKTTNAFLRWLQTTTTPYFGYLAFTACHGPLGVGNWPSGHHGFGDEPLDEYRNTRLRACLENVDYHIGRIMNAVDPNTTILLISDNGTPSPILTIQSGEIRYPIGHPLHASGDESMGYDTLPYDPNQAKSTVFEAGIRVPCIAYGKYVKQPGRICNQLLDVVDIHNSILDLLHIPNTGFSMMPVLSSPSGTIDRHFSFTEVFDPNGLGGPSHRIIQDRAYILENASGLWKLHDDYQAQTHQFKLYHLNTDPLETVDLGSGHPVFSTVLAAYWNFISVF